MIKICTICGKQFETKSGQRTVCYDIHYRVCKICGKTYPVEFKDLSKAECCSRECSNRARGRSHLTAVPRHEEVCEICGESFLSTYGTSRICPKHTTITCKWCGKVVPASRSEILNGKQTCSKECRYNLAHASYTSNYGKYVNPDNFEKMQERYKKSCIDKYGVANPMQSSEISSKAITTKRAVYGDKMEAINEKCIQTRIIRYGVPHLMQSEKFKKAAQETCLNRYGVDNYAKSSKFLLDVITDPSKAESCKSFREDPRKYISEAFDHPPTLQELGESCGIRDSSVGWIIDKRGCSDMISYDFSAMEDEMHRFLLTLVDNSEIVRNTFKVITPYELDIYLPNYRLAIECDPTITHNSTIPGFGPTDVPKDSSYHKMKTDMCESKEIFLFHVFGYDWTYRKDVIKSMIASLLGRIDNRYYARQTIIRTISDGVCTDFLDANHRQGAAHSSVRLGLYYNDRLVSVMTFSKMRNTIGKSKSTIDSCYELVRFCNEINTTVVGGASKLFKYFVDTYHPSEVRSFSDRAHTRGGLYTKLGFQYDHTSDPGYMWVNLKTDRGYARSNAQKQNIAKFLNDNSLDLTKTEVELMSEHGYVQVFDSGVVLWIWKGEHSENQS